MSIPEIPQSASGHEAEEVDHSDNDRMTEQAAVRTPRNTDSVNPLNVVGPPSDTEIAKARKYGFELTGQEKYFSKEEWARRNHAESS